MRYNKLAKSIVESGGMGELHTDSMIATVLFDHLHVYGGAAPDIIVTIPRQTMEASDLRQTAALFNSLARQMDKLAPVLKEEPDDPQ